ncbi:hypothetical protein Lalb_Chr07g0178111 [Lupinus albus]|uniref:Uncharacterized protein n=1 Tax=Lupinus albus TaxID=3870 RepID=A0A6A4Q8F4_LUPAL|nr:hypothetical protein Lalb_Chr07g0178111 [Lupinus albus]
MKLTLLIPPSFVLLLCYRKLNCIVSMKTLINYSIRLMIYQNLFVEVIVDNDNTNRDAECSTDISLPGYSGYNIGNNKLEVGSSPQVTTLGHGGSALNELNGTASLNVQHCEQFAYPPHPPDDVEMKHHQAMNSKPNTADYQIHNNFDLPRSLFENGHQFWNSGSGPCGIAMYNENGFHR